MIQNVEHGPTVSQNLSIVCNGAQDLSDLFIKLLKGDIFWSLFNLVVSPRDGHCIMHSIVRVLKSRDHDIKDCCTLLDKLRLECTKNHAIYEPSFDGGVGDFYHEMELYINYRIYDTGLCDLIPDIMAQILNTHIIVIDNAGSNHNVYVSNPPKHNRPTETTQSYSHVCNPIILHRAGYHYDACIEKQPWVDISAESHAVDNVVNCLNDEAHCHDYAVDRHITADGYLKNLCYCHDDLSDSHDNVIDCHDNAGDRHDSVSDCHADLVDWQNNVIHCHDNAADCRNSEGCCNANAVHCPDNVVDGRHFVTDCHHYILQDSSPCLNGSCNDESQLGINFTKSKEANSNLKGFDSIQRFKGNHPKNMFIGHYNINSERNKFCDIFPLFVKYDIDILGIAETKLNNSFTSK